MNRWSKVFGRALLLSATSILLSGQHNGGGGHGAGSGAVSHGGGYGMSPIAPFRMPSSIGLSPPSFGKNPANTYPAFSPSYGRTPGRNGSRYYSGRRNYVGAYPFIAAPYPFLYDNGLNPYDSAPADEGPPPPEGPAPEEGQLGAQVAQLSAQINDLQNQLGQRSAPPAELLTPSPEPNEQTPAPPPVTVVLNDGKTITVQNYAVMGDTFWDLSSQPMRKIDISKINIAASAQASEANGAEFPHFGASK